MTAAAQPDRVGQGSAATRNRIDNWLLLGGALPLCVALGRYVHLTQTSPGMWSLPLDLTVYRDSGLIVQHVHPYYSAHRSSPLYDWPGQPGFGGIKFIYPPFAVIPSHLRLRRLEQISSAINILAFVLAAVVMVGALGRERGLTVKRGLGIILLVTTIALITEPVQRTFYPWPGRARTDGTSPLGRLPARRAVVDGHRRRHRGQRGGERSPPGGVGGHRGPARSLPACGWRTRCCSR